MRTKAREGSIFSHPPSSRRMWLALPARQFCSRFVRPREGRCKPDFLHMEIEPTSVPIRLLTFPVVVAA